MDSRRHEGGYRGDDQRRGGDRREGGGGADSRGDWRGSVRPRSAERDGARGSATGGYRGSEAPHDGPRRGAERERSRDRDEWRRDKYTASGPSRPGGRGADDSRTRDWSRDGEAGSRYGAEGATRGDTRGASGAAQRTLQSALGASAYPRSSTDGRGSGSATTITSTATSATGASDAPKAKGDDTPIIDISEEYLEDEEAREARLLEESRKRREAILAKHHMSSAAPPPLLPSTGATSPPRGTVSAGATALVPAAGLPLVPPSTLTSSSTATAAPASGVGVGRSPVVSPVGPVARSASASVPKATSTSSSGGVAVGRVFSMFDEEEEGVDESMLHASAATATAGQAGGIGAMAVSSGAMTSLADNWDDPDGYYKVSSEHKGKLIALCICMGDTYLLLLSSFAASPTGVTVCLRECRYRRLRAREHPVVGSACVDAVHVVKCLA